jgi:hypothetical protein
MLDFCNFAVLVVVENAYSFTQCVNLLDNNSSKAQPNMFGFTEVGGCSGNKKQPFLGLFLVKKLIRLR